MILIGMLCSITACGNNNGNNNSNSTNPSSQTQSTPAPSNSNKTENSTINLENGSILEIKDNVIRHSYEKDGIKVESIYTFVDDKLDSFKMNLSCEANQDETKYALKAFKESFKEQGFENEEISDTLVVLTPKKELLDSMKKQFSSKDDLINKIKSTGSTKTN